MINLPMTLTRGIALATALGLTISAAPATVSINIVATNGSQSFTPNPATAVSGDSLVWRNSDFTVHRIVLDDGSLDTGNINPGASSPPMTLTGAGGSYHCVIHPSMVGAIGAAACAFTLAPASASAPSTASNGSVTVTAAAGCAWTAVSNSAVITVVSGASGSGNGTVGYNVAANTTTSPRSGSITIAGQTFTVTQAAAASCPTIVLGPSTLPSVTQGVPASIPLTASGGTAPYAFTVTAGSLPAGLALSSSGVLSGTPANPGSSVLTVRATDTAGCFAESAYTLTVVAVVPAMPATVLLLLAAGLIGIGWWRLARRRATLEIPVP